MPRSPRSTHRTPADGRNLERVIGIEAEPHSEGQNNAVVSASFTYLAVAGPIAPSISIISAGLPLSSADRSAGEANWTAAAIAATRVACTILTARLPDKTIYGGSLPAPQYVSQAFRHATQSVTIQHVGPHASPFPRSRLRAGWLP